jgi:hypothetical protein
MNPEPGDWTSHRNWIDLWQLARRSPRCVGLEVRGSAVPVLQFSRGTENNLPHKFRGRPMCQIVRKRWKFKFARFVRPTVWNLSRFSSTSAPLRSNTGFELRPLLARLTRRSSSVLLVNADIGSILGPDMRSGGLRSRGDEALDRVEKGCTI